MAVAEATGSAVAEATGLAVMRLVAAMGLAAVATGAQGWGVGSAVEAPGSAAAAARVRGVGSVGWADWAAAAVRSGW